MSESASGRPSAGRPGRRPAATREAVLALAKARYLAGERVDVQAIARELGLARVTMYRWFQTRERLLGEAIGELAEERLLAIRARTPRRGAKSLLKIFDRFNRDVAATAGLHALLDQDKDRAFRLLTSASGLVQPRVVATVARFIDEEVRAGRYVPPVDSALLAYGTVRLGEAFTYNDAVIGVRGDTRHLKELQAVLLGLRVAPEPPASTARRKAAAPRKRVAPAAPERKSSSSATQAARSTPDRARRRGR